MKFQIFKTKIENTKIDLIKKKSKVQVLFRGFCFLLMPISIGIFFFSPSTQASDSFFADSFSGDTAQWTPKSGAWFLENGIYKQKETGTNYISQTDTALFTDDFSTEAPATLATPFTETFTQVDGAAANWTVKRGSFAVSSNTYRAPNGGGYTLSIPTEASYNSWSDYRVTASFQRAGGVGTSGYSIFYFRSTVVGAVDNSYVLAIRQTGVANFYKKADSVFTLLGSFTVGADMSWHTLTAEIVGSTFKAWIDPIDYTVEAPDFSVSGLTDYTSGTIGIGTTGWVSYFDNVSVDTLTSGYQFTEKRCTFWANSGTYYAIPTGCEGVRPLAIITDPASLNWKNYRITAQVKNLGALLSSNYSMITFRTTMTGNNDNSYALLLRQDGTADVYEAVNNWASYRMLGTFNTDSDTDYHDVVIEVEGTVVKIWYDRDSDTQVPNFEYGHLTTYTSGTVGLGAMGAQSVFNSVTVDPLVSVQPKPSFLYAGAVNTSSFDINTSATVGDLIVTVVNPAQTIWTLTNPAACVGQNNCLVVFPTDFSGANITQLGTYKITVQRGNNISYSLLEVREQPLYSFVQVADIHYNDGDSNATEDLNQINYFVADINSQKYFPTPSFVTATGDLTDDGSLIQLLAVENEFDELTVPFYPIVSSHDTTSEIGDAMGTNWQTVFGADKFSYNWTSGDYLFLAMDGQAPFGGYGNTLGSVAHKTWLQNILNANPTKKVIFFSHYSLNEPRSGGAAQGFWNEDASEDVRAILEGHGGVVAEFAGHDHLNSWTSVNDISYITTSGFYTNDQYRYVEVYADRIVSKIIRVDSYSYDQDDELWPGSFDSTHTTSNYSFGLPKERNMEINFLGSEVTTPVETVSVAGSVIWQDYEYSADITVRNDEIVGENIVGLVFRYTDADNYYSVVLDSAADTITLRKRVSGVVTDIASHSATITPDVTYSIDLSVLGDDFIITLDDVSEISTTDSTFVAGKIGLSSYSALNEFDNVLVQDLSNPEDFVLSSPADGSTITIQPTFVWNPSSDPESGLAKYQLFIDGVLDSDDIDPETTSVTANTILTHGTHTWFVKAFNESGGSTQSLTFTIGMDTQVPTLGISLDDTALKIGDTPTVTFTFSEAPTNFTVDDITAANGDLSDFAGVGTEYTATFTSDSGVEDDTNTIAVGTSWTDAAGNPPAGSTNSENYEIDTARPTVAITDDQDGTVSDIDTTVLYTFEFNETVIDFTTTDVTINAGGTKGAFTATDGNTYTLLVNASDNSTTSISLTLAKAAFTDINGNTMVADATDLVQAVDTVNPTIIIESDDASLNKDDTATITFTLSESSVNFVEGDVDISGGTLSGWTPVSGTSYTVTFTPTDESSTNGAIHVDAAKFTDAAGNNNTVSDEVSLIVDTIAPIVNISLDDTALKIGDTPTVTFTFSEAPTNFTVDDITAANGDLSDFAGVGTEYTATFTSDSGVEDDTNTIAVGTSWTDVAGNPPAGLSNSANYEVDTTRPTVTISDDQDNTATDADTTVLYTFEFNENVTGFTTADVTINAGGTKGDFTAIDGNTYTLIVNVNDDSVTNLSLTISNIDLIDANANLMAAEATEATQAVDTRNPTIIIETDDTFLNKDDTAIITFTLSESSANFVEGDVDISGGTLSGWTPVSGTSYTVIFIPTDESSSNGTIHVDTAKFTDTAGNNNTVSNEVSLTVNTIAPTVIIFLDDTALKISDTSTITLTFSEAPTNFTVDDVTAANGDLSYFAGEGTEYTATFTPDLGVEDDTNTITVGTSWTDAVGNPPAGLTESENYEVDTRGPTFDTTIMRDANGDGKVDRIVFTFSEALVDTAAGVNGFDVSSITDHGTCSLENTNPAASSTLSLDFSCSDVNTGVGDLKIDFTTNSGLMDTAGNQVANISLTSATIIDDAAPVVVSAFPDDSSTNIDRESDVVLTFSEPMITTFNEDTQFDVTPDSGDFTKIWSSGNSVVTLSHVTKFGCSEYVYITTNEAEINAAVGSTTNVITTGPVDGDWSFRTKACGSSSPGGGSSPTVPPVIVPPINPPVVPDDDPEENPPTVDTDTTTVDDEGRTVANNSGQSGPSPVTGLQQTISTVSVGQFIRSYSFCTIYLVGENDIRHPFWDTNTFFTYADSWDEVVWVTDATLPTMTMGSNVLPKPGVTLVKIKSDSRVFAVDSGETLRWIPDEATARSLYGQNWADYVIDLEPTIFSRFARGDDMTTTSVVDIGKIKTRTELAALAQDF